MHLNVNILVKMRAVVGSGQDEITDVSVSETGSPPGL